MKHDKIETNINLMAILIAVVISIGGLVEIIPLMASASMTPAPKPAAMRLPVLKSPCSSLNAA